MWEKFYGVNFATLDEAREEAEPGVRVQKAGKQAWNAASKVRTAEGTVLRRKDSASADQAKALAAQAALDEAVLAAQDIDAENMAEAKKIVEEKTQEAKTAAQLAKKAEAAVRRAKAALQAAKDAALKAKNDFEELAALTPPCRFIKLLAEPDECYFDTLVYRRRMDLIIEPFLLDSDKRAKDAHKKAYLHVVGLGLGNWKANDLQQQLQIDS